MKHKFKNKDFNIQTHKMVNQVKKGLTAQTK